ncbi:MAG TPA: metallophosphoesterase [Vicinamibacteria bacterium]|nr:metallophosphoesterase [Vicinamibacteria bacterium]
MSFAVATGVVLALFGASDPAAHARTDPSVAVLVGAGDIADCKAIERAQATAQLLDGIPGTVFTVGDHAYRDGTERQFAECYEPTWGRHKQRTRPAVGNHEYHSPLAAPYFAYFGPAAGAPGRGYYCYSLGAWHVAVLNSNCDEVDCSEGSPQERWLRDDLAAHKTACALAYWHHPRFSSGKHGSSTKMTALFRALYDAGVELAISGHDHLYERFAPQDATGRLDPARGVRQFVVGTGGRRSYRFETVEPNSEVRATDILGVLRLTLTPDRYGWDFVPVAGQTFADSGTEACH